MHLHLRGTLRGQRLMTWWSRGATAAKAPSPSQGQRGQPCSGPHVPTASHWDLPWGRCPPESSLRGSWTPFHHRAGETCLYSRPGQRGKVRSPGDVQRLQGSRWDSADGLRRPGCRGPHRSVPGVTSHRRDRSITPDVPHVSQVLVPLTPSRGLSPPAYSGLLLPSGPQTLSGTEKETCLTSAASLTPGGQAQGHRRPDPEPRAQSPCGEARRVLRTRQLPRCAQSGEKTGFYKVITETHRSILTTKQAPLPVTS